MIKKRYGTGESLFKTQVNPNLKLSVIVPAKNEAESIYHTLHALNNQIDENGKAIDQQTYEVLVLANNCSDDTYAVCKAYQRKYPDFNLLIECVKIEDHVAHIGTARRLLMDAAYERLQSTVGDQGIIVSTDADSVVDTCWVFYILKEMHNGADVVGGRILPRETPEASRLHHLRDVTYRFLKSKLEDDIDPCLSNPWPRHFQCYGPSLAVTCAIYEKAGRIPAIPYLEDEEFRKALKRIDAKIRHSPQVKIYTSSRLNGRVAFGFSVQLQQWSDMSLKGEEQKVESLKTLLFKYELKSRLRNIWADKRNLPGLKIIAEWIEIGVPSLLKMWQASTYFESFWEMLEQYLDEKGDDRIYFQSISDSIRSLREYLYQRKEPALKAVINALQPETIAV